MFWVGNEIVWKKKKKKRLEHHFINIIKQETKK